MIRLMSSAAPPTFSTVVHPRAAIAARAGDLTAFVRHSEGDVPLSKHPLWLNVLQNSLGHEIYAIEATAGACTVGFLPVACVSSMLFGRFLMVVGSRLTRRPARLNRALLAVRGLARRGSSAA